MHHVGWDFSAPAELFVDVEAQMNPAAGEGNLDIVHLPRMVRKIKRTTRVRHPCLLQLPQAILDIVRFLVEAGAAKKGATPLMAAVRLMADIGALPPPKVRRTGDVQSRG